jgi:tetratricopeptide (TPR) repeat protein/DNA-binding XRE family transcriptional regulator
MRREHMMARMLRALSGKTQAQFGEETGIEASSVALFEVGKLLPSQGHLERMAAAVALTVSQTEELLRFVDTLRRPRRRRGTEESSLLDGIAAAVRSEVGNAYRRLLALRLPHAILPVEGRQRAAELFERLEALPQEARLAMVQVAEECWSWALCERVCDASESEASRDIKRARAWADLAGLIADRVQHSEEWRDRLRGYAAAHVANVLRVAGDLALADSKLAEAKRLWRAGSDPAGALDPGRILDLEASLRRDQRRLPEALALLDEAAAVGRFPERALIKKSTTLEVMGRYDVAVEALLRALPIVQRKGDRHLEAVLCCNLALSYCQLGRFAEAAELAARARTAALEMGDELGALRVTWTQGRIAAGTGRSAEARSLLAYARREFANRGMDYDAALALLEESALLLAEGRAGEAKALARDLAALFDSKGVHREALAALRLFQEATEQERATAELARSVLSYLFRARHDPSLRFAS